MIASTVTRRGTRLLESFSKLVERREAVKLYLAHKLAKFFCCWVSNTCVCPRRRVHSKRGYRVHVVARNWLVSRRYTTCVSLALVCQVTCERYCSLNPHQILPFLVISSRKGHEMCLASTHVLTKLIYMYACNTTALPLWGPLRVHSFPSVIPSASFSGYIVLCDVY